jgi:hypothetical protein
MVIAPTKPLSDGAKRKRKKQKEKLMIIASEREREGESGSSHQEIQTSHGKKY